MPSAIIS